MANQATRYSGSLKIIVKLRPDHSYGAELFDGSKRLCALEGLNLSPHKQRTISADSSEAYSRIAASAISFAAHDNPSISDTLYSLAMTDERGEFIISNRKM